MNKYQEYLNNLESIPFDEEDNLLGDYETTIAYDEDGEEYQFNVRETFFNLQELVDKEEKYRWHDLRKDPNDLPTQDNIYLVAYDFKDEILDMKFRSIEVVVFMEGKFGIDDIVAWKYIEGFQDE